MRIFSRIALAGITFLSLFSRAEFSVPPLQGPVMDLAAMIAPADRAILEDKIRAVNASGIAQIQILTLPNLQGLPIENASIQITDQWKLGDAQKDNGILVLVAKEERRLRLEVGQGLEGILPDVVAKRITSEVMTPYFRQGLPSLGVVKGVDAVILQLNDGQPLKDVERQAKPRRQQKFPPLMILGLFLFVIIFRNFFGGRGRRSGWYGGGYGGGGFGSSSGGSWSGGGGGFSGGGASDGW